MLSFIMQSALFKMKLAIILLLALIASLQAQEGGPTILSVSGTPNNVTHPVFSSLRGGKLIYINVIGHDPMAQGNQVFVGTYPCIIPSDGVTDTYITCETTDSGSTTGISSLPVTVISNGVAFTIDAPNVVNYATTATPYLAEVFPDAGYANTVVSYYGIHRITDLGDGRLVGDVVKMLLGGDLCSRFDVIQDIISDATNQYIQCIQSSLQVAGKYNVSEQVTPGFASHSLVLRKASLTNEYFQFTALPAVSSISPSSGNLGGQFLTISGTGFALVAKNNTVTVDGNPCQVTSSSETQISCTVAPKNNNLSSLLSATNSSAQVNGYFAGSGLKYARYSLSGSATIDNFVTAVRGQNSTYLSSVQEQGFRASLKEGDLHGSNYGQTWNGYFTAPTNGTYVFRGIADDYFAFYIAPTYGSTDLPASPLIYSNNHQISWSNYYNDDPANAEGSISLTAGNSYYMEAYHINTVGGGYFKVNVDVPNSDTTLPFQAFEVDKIVTNSTVNPEIVTYTMTSGTPGSINMRLVRTDSKGAINYNVNTTFSYGCTAAQFANALNQFNSFSSYQISVTRDIYDSSNNSINTTVGAASIVYTVSIYLLRSAAYSTEDFIYTYTNYTGTVTKGKVQDHSPLISGTFSLTIGSVPFNNIAYNAGGSTIQALIRSIDGYENVLVDQVSANGAGYANTWIISYVGVNGNIPSPTVIGAGLSGGANTPSIALTVRRNYSTAITFEPVDYRFFNTFSSQANVLVSTNGIPAICTGNCGYTFFDKLKITSLSQNGTTLSLALTPNPANLTIDISSLTITVQGNPCAINPSSSLAALTCTLANNSDGSPLLVAGTATPVVFSNPIGIAGLNTGVNPISVPLVVSRMTAVNGGNNGGYYNYIMGSGFPLDRTKVTVTVCNTSATIVSSKNQQIKFYMPACSTVGAQNVTVLVGSLSDSLLVFTYNNGSLSAPNITSISPTTQNPAIKGLLHIVGSGFGTNKTAVQVFLSNSSGKVYQLNILSVNDTNVEAGLSGGLSGPFTVQVTLPDFTGDNIAAPGVDQFQYLCSITSVSPSTGSYNGGTLLTITGTNFSPAYSDTLVYIGDTLNWFCNIETITATQITCRTPPISSAYTVGSAQRVVISTKLYLFNTCPGNNCNFSYIDSSSSPHLTSSPSSANAVNVTLTGTNFVTNATNSTCSASLAWATNSSLVYTAPSITCTATSTKFTVPKTVPSGNYLVRVRNQIGESNGRAIAINWAPGTPSFNSGGSLAGNIITFTGGSGYPASLGNGNGYNVLVQTSIGANLPVNIVSCCTNNELTLSMPPTLSNKQVYIVFKGPVTNTNSSYLYQQSMTPIITYTGSALTPGLNSTISFARTDSISLSNVNITQIQLVSTIDSSNVIPIPTWSVNDTSKVFSFVVSLASGAYSIRALTPNGYCQVDNPVNVSLDGSVSALSQSSGFSGGYFTITGSNLSPSSYITVNSFKGTIKSYNSSSITYNVPSFVTATTQTAFNLAQVTQIDSSLLTLTSDQSSNITNVTAAFDGILTTIYGSPSKECWIKMDVGQGMQAKIDRVRFFPFLDWDNTVNYTLGAVFEGSNNNLNWTNLGTFDQTAHSGWNVIRSSTSAPFRYIKFRHTNQSQCNLAEIQLYGIVLSSQTPSLSNQSSTVTYNDGFNSHPFNNSLQFTSAATPTVTSVVPPYGDIFGNYNINITGTNLGLGIATVLIDSIPCTIVSNSSTSIICTVGARPKIPTTNTFTVTVGNSKAIIVNDFLYVLKWSDSRTWGVDLPPIQGDLVYVPPGMSLLVDTDTPILAGIAVENGALIFPNDTDVTVQSYFITLNGGKFIAGTESAPLHSKLTFIMHGNYYGKQQPMFGNKGIGCLNCKFSMYGRPRKPTWTTIAATIYPGNKTFTTSVDVDWQVGETIVVASTSFFHYEAEERTITAVSNRTITVDTPFQNQHVSVLESYGNDKLEMRAEVGLLTRNIKMMGDPTSAVGKYGSHLMLAATMPDALEGHVAYSEFTHCGQPQILGRYCIHFHMAGDVPTSFVRGNAVHESFARVVTIHGVYQLLVEDNVGYRVRGHNYFIEDGIETHNIIRNNLAISSLTVTNMLQTDISVASFWITNPTNDFYGNHAAGGDFYGIWYEIKTNPDGPSATNDVCPPGNPLGYVANNVAHSNIRFGLRIFRLYSRKYPCQEVRDDSNATDPWYSNPSIPSVFYNFTIYKNLEDGVLSEQSGNLMISNFTIAENYHGGVEFYYANFTKEMVSVDNCAIIGMSQTNAASDTTNYTDGMAGVITPRTGQSNVTNTRFYNYPAGSIAFVTCSKCDDKMFFSNLGNEIFIKNLTFDGVDGNYLYMMGLKRDVIYDLDASLSGAFGNSNGNRTSATIVHNFNHISAYYQRNCTHPTEDKWDSAIMCDQTITIRRIYFTNIVDQYTFNAQYMKVKPISSYDEVVSLDPVADAGQYTSVQSRYLDHEPKREKPQAWSLPFVTGNIYQIWWGSGLDFSHLSISTSTLYKQSDAGVVFKFNYTFNRELYFVGPMRGGNKLQSIDYISEDSNFSSLDPATCRNGEFYHNNDNSSLRMLTICQSGKNRTQFEYTEVNAVICLYHCPAPAGTFIKESFTRLWSNASQWPNQTVPQSMDNVTVNGNWTVLLDVDPAPLNYLVIDGTLIADDTRDVNITARSIFIRAGNVTAGSSNAPFMHKFTIQISNTKEDHGWYIDPLVAGNKYVIVTGSLNLFGVAPTTVTTSLTAPASVGDTVISVASSTDWAVGDVLALSPSYGKYTEYEQVTITAINNATSISVTPLQYNHYGSGAPISTPYGSIDVNTHVGHLNRNVQIVPGPDYGWGVNILVYGFMDGDIRRVGSVKLVGVEIVNGGQYDTPAAALQFLNVVNGNYSSLIKGTSFVNCRDWCVNINNIMNVTFDNNVFYNGRVFGVQAISFTNFQFINNLLIGIIERPSMTFGTELVACFATYDYVNAATANVLVKNNFCLGSQGHGFAFPHIKCSELETNPFAGNTAGSCQIGFIFNNIPAPDNCKAFSYINAYANEIGQICGPISTTRLVFKNFVMVDNQRGATLKFGNGEGDSNHTGIFTNSYISALSRPNCSQCYGDSAINCNNNIGLRLLTASANGQVLPGKFGPGFDVICKQPLFENKVYMTNVTFDHFSQSYAGALSTVCGSNFVFRGHSSAFDTTADTNLFNVACSNCDTNSYLLADQNSQNQLGWFGGCGDIVCTGRSNYLINDWSGTFLGYQGSIVPNNPVIGDNEPNCTFSSAMNAYKCTRTDFAVLAYQSIAADFKTRIMWPMNLTYEGSNYTTVTNAWREWDWSGKEPLNHRFGRFVSIVTLNKVYNLTGTAMPPVNMQFQIQKRTPEGNNNNFVVIKMYYPMPNMIQVKVNGVIKDPILLTDGGLKRNLNTTLCGDNIYFYTNYTTHFVVTEDLNCLVEVLLTDNIQLTTHFAMNINDFFTNSKLSSFISNLCALIGITDTSRVKVVGVVSGSVIVTTTILPPSGNATNGSSTDPSLAQVQSTLNQNSSIVGSSLASNLNTTLISMSSTILVLSSTSSESSSASSASNVGLIVGVAVAGAVLIVGLVLVFFYCLRKRAKIVEEIRQSEEEVHHEKEIELIADGHHFDAHQASHMSEFKIVQNEFKKEERVGLDE